ncbi:MAG: hypothetical protein J6X01_03260 [Bacteroidales bacterium]|nr:hypothetical protein [Bacteroidales bacterium]
MKKITFSLLCLLTAGAVAFAMVGFDISPQPKKRPLVVERQECMLQHMVGFIPSHDIDIGMIVDVPVSGDNAVADSIMRFINEVVYGFMESGDGSGFTPEQVYCAEAKHFVKHYYNAYKPLIPDTCYEIGDGPGRFCDPEYFSVTMLDQTDAFVTYEVGTLYLGEGATYLREWYTFYKSDGRRVQDIITTDNLRRFYNEHPEVQNELRDMMGEYTGNFDDIEGRSVFGLSGDSLLHQFRIPGDVYEAAYDLKVIKPYLTEEAKKLLENPK